MTDSTLYERLSSTATTFIHACRPNPEGSNKVDADRISSTLASSFKINFGHSLWISNTPFLQGYKDGPGYINHMSTMSANLHSWENEIVEEETIVDVQRRRVMLRVTFRMKPTAEDAVVNDIVFAMTMDESGEKLVKVTEFVDPTAGAEIARLMEKAGNKRVY